MSDDDRRALHTRNVLILVGILITSAGIIYFATEFIDRISEWGRLASMVLLAVFFVSLGIHFEQQGEGGEVSARHAWRWLRVGSALFILGIVSAFIAAIVFLSMDDIDRVFKVLVTIAVGLGLILFAARRFGPTTKGKG